MKKPKPSSSRDSLTSQTGVESRESVEAWACDLVAAIGKRQTRTVLADYKRLAADKELSEFDRAVAKQRAAVLSKLIDRDSERPAKRKAWTD